MVLFTLDIPVDFKMCVVVVNASFLILDFKHFLQGCVDMSNIGILTKWQICVFRNCFMSLLKLQAFRGKVMGCWSYLGDMEANGLG